MKKISKCSIVGLGLLAIGCEATDDQIPEGDEVIESSDEARLGDDVGGLYEFVPADHEIVMVKRRKLDGIEFTFIKHMDEEGNVEGQILDAAGNPIADAALPTPKRQSLGRALQDRLTQGDPDEQLDIYIALADPSAKKTSKWTEQGNADLDRQGAALVTVDGTGVTKAELKQNGAARQAHAEKQVLRRRDAHREMLRELAVRYPRLDTEPALRTAIERGDASVTLPLRSHEVAQFLADNDDLVAALDLSTAAVGTIAGAMLDTGVDRGPSVGASVEMGSVYT